MKKLNSVFLQKLVNTSKEFNLIKNGESILVAVSGGVDSVSLLYALHELRHYFAIKLYCATFNHQIRPSSKIEVEFVKGICKKLSIGFFTCSANVPEIARAKKTGIEETARVLRYDFLFKTAKKVNASKIATAHHLDDFVENFIMRLTSGGGSGSIAGIKAVNGMLIRPLIKHTKKDIYEFARYNSIKFYEDFTNYDKNIFRNYIRFDIIPGLKKYNSSFLKTIYKTSEIFRKDDEFIAGEALKVFDKIACCKYEKSACISVNFNTDDFKKLPDAIIYRIIKKAVSILGPSNPDLPSLPFDRQVIISSDHFRMFIDLIRNKRPNLSFNLNAGIEIKKVYDRIIFKDASASRNFISFKGFIFGIGNEKQSYEYTILGDRHNIYIKEIGKTFILEKLKSVTPSLITQQPANNLTHPDVAFFDFDKLIFPVTVRNFKNGDRFIPLGMTGNKKIKNYFIDNKVPLEIRRVIPLILFGNDIVWICYNAMSDVIKVTNLTKNIGMMKIE